MSPLCGCAEASKESGTRKTTEVLWRSGGSCFLLNLIAEKSAHDEYLPKFTALLNSFEALEAPKGETPADTSSRPDKTQ